MKDLEVIRVLFILFILVLFIIDLLFLEPFHRFAYMHVDFRVVPEHLDRIEVSRIIEADQLIHLRATEEEEAEA